MNIGLLVVEFRLDGCRSLKEKRRILSGLRERFGKQPNLAVCESDYHDELRRAQWSFLAVSTDGKLVDRMLASLEERIESEVDALITSTHREEM